MDRSWWWQSTRYKQLSVRRRLRRAWNRIFPRLPIILRVFPGVWWIAQDDAISDQLFAGFELSERRFLSRLLAPGMTVLDIGAHAGLYTVIASKLVGASGRIISFEPSARERRRLKRHLSLNRCRNVTVMDVALGDEEGHSDLFIVDGRETGCNSLRPGPGIPGRSVRVRVRCLDNCQSEGMFTSVDFVKMDIEGGELSALRGARGVFRSLRPALLCEVEEARLEPWNCRGREIIDLVGSCNYRWFALDDRGGLKEVPATQDRFHGNYAALPSERSDDVLGRLGAQED
jgi:FkbM family methyltransferase